MNQLLQGILLLVVGLVLSPEVRAGTLLRAGAAKIRVTPSEPVALAGFYVRQGPFKGIHDELYARAVVFESGGVVAAVVSVDVCVLTDIFCDDVMVRTAEKYPIPRDHILLNASHTHGGPALYEPPGSGVLNAFWLDENPYADNQKKYTEALKEKIVQVVGEARQKLVPAHIGFGKGSCSIGINRRALTAKGDFVIGVKPGGPIDPEVCIVRVDDLEGKTLALMFNHGTHGVSMMSEQLTGDWCGIASQYIEEIWGEGVIAPFLSGAAGDVNSIYVQRKDFDDPSGNANMLAEIIGKEVIRAAQGITPEFTGPVKASQRVAAVPGKRYLGLLGIDPEYEERAKNTSPVPDTRLLMSALRVGEVIFAASSGEVFCEIGREFKEKSPYPRSLFMGITNGYSSYILTDREIGRGGYEYNASVVKSGGQAAVVNTLLDLVAEFK